MATRLVIDGNAVYEIDEDCLKSRRRKEAEQRLLKSQETGKQKKERKKQ